MDFQLWLQHQFPLKCLCTINIYSALCRLQCFQGVGPRSHLALHKGSIWKCVSHALLIHNCTLTAPNSSVRITLSWLTSGSNVSQSLRLRGVKLHFTPNVSFHGLLPASQPDSALPARARARKHTPSTCPGSPEHDTV